MNDNRDNHKNKIRLFHDQNVAREHHWQKRVGKDRLKGYGMNKRLSVTELGKYHASTATFHLQLGNGRASTFLDYRPMKYEVCMKRRSC